MHVLKTDDDSNVEMDKLQVELLQLPPDYWGHVRRGAQPVRDPKYKYFLPVSMGTKMYSTTTAAVLAMFCRTKLWGAVCPRLKTKLILPVKTC